LEQFSFAAECCQSVRGSYLSSDIYDVFFTVVTSSGEWKSFWRRQQ